MVFNSSDSCYKVSVVEFILFVYLVEHLKHAPVYFSYVDGS